MTNDTFGINRRVIKNKYRSNVGKLAAWLSASHIERVPVENPRNSETPNA